MKDPAVLFYTGDFLNGCTDLTFEERGQYITLLCLQHQKGHLSDKTIRLCVGSVSVDVLKKFSQDDTGCYFNERMDTEINKRQQFLDSRYFNGKRGGRPKKANSKPNSKPTQNLPEDENENEDLNINKDVKRKKKPEFDFSFLSEVHKENFMRWISYKKSRNEMYKSQMSLEACYRNLLKFSDNDINKAQEIVDQSMGNNWQGLFPLKINNNGANKSTNSRGVKDVNKAWGR